MNVRLKPCRTIAMIGAWKNVHQRLGISEPAMDLWAMHLLGGGPGVGCKASPRVQLQPTPKWHESTELACSPQLDYGRRRVCCCNCKISHAGEELLPRYPWTE